MNQWNGLIKKEWLSMKGTLFFSALFSVVILLFLPMVIYFFLGVVNVFEISLVLCAIWAGVSTLVPVITLFTMLGRDVKRPDVWLHSPASIFHLVGVKAVFAIVVGIAALLIPTVVLAFQYMLHKPAMLPLSTIFTYGSLYNTGIFLIGVYFLCIGFFFYVIDLLLKPFLKGFSFIVTLILFFTASRFYAEFANSIFYRKFIQTGAVDLSFPKHGAEMLGVQFVNTSFYGVEMLFNALFAVALFVSAALLFEKKVRL